MLVNVLVAVAAVAAPIIAVGPPPNIGCMVDSACSMGQVCQHNICVVAPAPPKAGCMVDSDCSTGQVCQHNICATAPTPPKVGCMFDSDCSSRQDCQHNICVAGKKPKSIIRMETSVTFPASYCEECKKTKTKTYKPAPKPTITIIECKECEGGYATSTCYPDITVTVTGCNTCLRPTAPFTVLVVPAPASSLCTTTSAKPTIPIWVSGAERTHVAFAGAIGAVVIAALMI